MDLGLPLRLYANAIALAPLGPYGSALTLSAGLAADLAAAPTTFTLAPAADHILYGFNP